MLDEDNQIIDYVYNDPGTSVKEYLDRYDYDNTHRAYHIATVAQEGKEKGAMTGWAQEKDIIKSLKEKYKDLKQKDSIEKDIDAKE